MNVTLSTPQSNNTCFIEFSSKEELKFTNHIQKDEELFFLLSVFVKALVLQLERVEKFYLYDEIEGGEILEELSEKNVELTIDEAIDLIKVLASSSYYVESSTKIHKVCDGHKNERIKTKIKPKDYEKIEQGILTGWKEDQNLKTFSLLRVNHAVLFRIGPLNRYYDIYAEYIHKDNIPECSSYTLSKRQATQNICLVSILDKFEEKISNYKLNRELEWSKLTKFVFKERLTLTREGFKYGFC